MQGSLNKLTEKVTRDAQAREQLEKRMEDRFDQILKLLNNGIEKNKQQEIGEGENSGGAVITNTGASSNQFHIRDPSTMEAQDTCKSQQLYMLIVDEKEHEEEKGIESDAESLLNQIETDIEISLHALIGSVSQNTIRIQGLIKKSPITILIDTLGVLIVFWTQRWLNKRDAT
ncbi:hypothetical protein IFM89_004851 [Coptis chinensis]|uniref:Uncharacterized protein n=1 Tax=Coptis chinensis TaxID=261450 RepID=A0A835LGI1_9MAGN|nr:hypothetical protein IFM89_004851 [Coptis chinensis]